MERRRRKRGSEALKKTTTKQQQEEERDASRESEREREYSDNHTMTNEKFWLTPSTTARKKKEKITYKQPACKRETKGRLILVIFFLCLSCSVWTAFVSV